MVNDRVGDFIIQLKNAGAVKKTHVSVPYSKLLHAVATKLADAGYIGTVRVTGKDTSRKLEVELLYENDTPRINGVTRMSKPGRRVYTKVSEIYPVKFGRGNVILSTPAGILTDKEARAAHVGGEQLFMIW